MGMVQVVGSMVVFVVDVRSLQIVISRACK